MQLILLGGRSGAGKTTVMHLLEDLGFFYIDNLPVSLLLTTIEQIERDALYDKVVIGLDPRSFELHGNVYADALSTLKGQISHLEIWSLEADHDALVIRYNETRRKHPFSNDKLSLVDALLKEKETLKPLDESATNKINTTKLNIIQLRAAVKENLQMLGERQLQVHISSFGFKYSVPNKVDFLFDVRCLPNPYWHPKLRTQSGLDKEVIDFFSQYEDVKSMEDDIYHFIKTWIPKFKAQDRSYLDIGIGCTGGQHRSVFLAERLSVRLNESSGFITVNHRELKKW